MKGDHGLKIDLLMLYTQGDTKSWNKYLADCLRTGNLHSLERTLRGIQIGMTDLAKQKLNDDKINEWYVRLQRSLERTMRDIIRFRNPNPCDDPLKAKDFLEAKASKVERDNQIESYLKRIRY